MSRDAISLKTLIYIYITVYHKLYPMQLIDSR